MSALWKKIKKLSRSKKLFGLNYIVYFIGLKDGALNINFFTVFFFFLLCFQTVPFFYNFPRLGNDVCEFFFFAVESFAHQFSGRFCGIEHQF